MRGQAALLVSLFGSACLVGCGPGAPGAEGCRQPDDCAPRSEALCASCVAEVGQLCVAGSCEATGQQLAAVVADVMLHFSLTGQVASIVYTFVDPRSPERDAGAVTCAALQQAQPSITDPVVNAVHSGFVNFQDTSGTAFFPDANLGSPPLGRHLLDVRGFSQARGGGEMRARCCSDDVEIVDTAENRLDLELDPA